MKFFNLHKKKDKENILGKYQEGEIAQKDISIYETEMLLKEIGIRKMHNNIQFMNEIQKKKMTNSYEDMYPLKNIKELTDWYINETKKYVEIIENEENENNLKCTCGKGCSHCCYQAIYITGGEYLIIENYLVQLPNNERKKIKEKVKEDLRILEKAGVPLFLNFNPLNEQKINNDKYFNLKISCPFLSEQNECKIYEIRPCPCFNYRSYGNPTDCKESFRPYYANAFNELEESYMMKIMFKSALLFQKRKNIQTVNFNLLNYAVFEILK